MLKKISLTDLHATIKDKIEDKTGLRCYDVVDTDIRGPFYFLQCVGKQDNSTKTMFVEDFKFYVHAISDTDRATEIYDLIQKVEEALTEDIDLGCEFNLVRQTEDGIVQILTEQGTKEKHAVLSYTFSVCYGYKVKI